MNLDPLLYSYVLVLGALAVSSFAGLKEEKEILFSSLRTSVQLLALGYALGLVLKIDSPFELALLIVFMVGVSSVIAFERIRHLRVLWVSFLAIGIATAFTVLPLLITGVLSAKPHHLIPFGGLIVGNTLHSVSISLDRLIGEVKARLEEIEAKVSLGSTVREALREIFVSSLKASLIPKINFMKAAGLVHIPGVAVGMLMAGSDPSQAVIFQIVILYAMVFAGLLGSYIALQVGYPLAFEEALKG